MRRVYSQSIEYNQIALGSLNGSAPVGEESVGDMEHKFFLLGCLPIVYTRRREVSRRE